MTFNYLELEYTIQRSTQVLAILWTDTLAKHAANGVVNHSLDLGDTLHPGRATTMGCRCVG